MKQMRIKYNKKGGFTLIEMLIVIAIIGILSSIILVGLGQFRGRGRDARRISDLSQVQNALELYFAKLGEYPDASDWGGLTVKLTGAGIGITQIPKDPTPTQDYGYCRPSASQYTLAAKLEDSNNPVLSEQSGLTFNCNPTGFSCGQGNDYCKQL